MPPRKSNVSTVSNGAEEGADATPAKGAQDGMSVEDLSLPKSMIARLAKGVLPANTSIQKDALLALHKSATVFVNYVASGANETTQAAGKKTIMPADVMTAMKDAEFEDFIPRLEAELKKYNEMQCDKRNTYRRKVKEEKAAAARKDGDGKGGHQADDEGANKERSASEAINGQLNADADEDDRERPFKKFKAQNGAAVAPNPDAMDETEETVDAPDDEADDAAEDDVEDDEQLEEDAEEDADEEADEDDRDDIAAAAGLRDEALDDPGSDSD